MNPSASRNVEASEIQTLEAWIVEIDSVYLNNPIMESAETVAA